MSNKKPYIIIGIVIAYVIFIFGFIALRNNNMVIDEVDLNLNETSVNEDDQNTNDTLTNTGSKIEYLENSDDVDALFMESEDVEIKDVDKENILVKYQMPSLSRMSNEDQETLMSDIQVLKRVEALGMDINDFYTPEYNWKSEYNNSISAIKNMINYSNTVEFSGTTASELNILINESENTRIDIVSSSIELDETIILHSNIYLNGNNVNIEGNNDLKYGIYMENSSNAYAASINLLGGYKHGIYIINSNNILVFNNNISKATSKGIAIMGTNSNINVVNNNVFNNGDGGLFLDGEIAHCIIEDNVIYDNSGTDNFSAGIVLSGAQVANIYDTDNPGGDELLYERLVAPHDNVIRSNSIQENYSSGIYSFSAYKNYIIENKIKGNEKEGMCLDFGTFGTYVSNNEITKNGNRDNQTNEDLAKDYIGDMGRMNDGTSKAKLPGISIDNGAYNIVAYNSINNNYGSGVKFVRSAYRNFIFSNTIDDNNLGVNDTCFGFGVELGYESKPDIEVNGLDFTADYENIIARNVIGGSHYSGIYIAQESYCNDLIDNIIMDSTNFCIENHSDKFNSAIGNTINGVNLNFDNY